MRLDRIGPALTIVRTMSFRIIENLLFLSIKPEYEALATIIKAVKTISDKFTESLIGVSMTIEAAIRMRNSETDNLLAMELCFLRFLSVRDRVKQQIVKAKKNKKPKYSKLKPAKMLEIFIIK